ncbi:MAG: hypothetical protein CMF55_00340 [Legionellales bacterium]|nr:hypothetical protein [Legionellales bacterium]
MKLSIKKSSRYVPKGVDIKDIILGDDVVGYIYPVEGDDHRGIWQINNNRECKRNGWVETPNGFAVELEENSVYLRKIFKELTGHQHYEGVNFFYYERSSIITIFPTLNEARKFARGNFGTPHKLRSYLVEVILATMRRRADHHIQRELNNGES